LQGITAYQEYLLKIDRNTIRLDLYVGFVRPADSWVGDSDIRGLRKERGGEVGEARASWGGRTQEA
jgi:hypothetical protein